MSKRLTSIDALRGAAALWVVVYHLHLPVPGPFHPLVWFMDAGVLGVYLFFAISGFCIHLKWAKEGSEPEFWPFWKRRIRRLYPPYLAALVLYLLVAGLTGQQHFGRFFAYDLAMHLSMLHNLDARTAFSLNGVFWTLALEEQLYLLYFLLLPLRRRYGWSMTLITTLAARVVWITAGAWLQARWSWALPWFPAAASNWFAWALGALAAEAHFDRITLPSWLERPYLLVAGLTGSLALIHYEHVLMRLDLHSAACDWLSQPLYGFVFFLVLLRAVRREKEVAVSGLGIGLARIGLWSYSLYLMHELALRYSAPLLGRALGIPRAPTLLLLLPLALASAYGFFRLAELPFMSPARTSAPSAD